MTIVQLHCPLCQGAFQVENSMAGQNVHCPLCQGVVTISSFAPQEVSVGVNPSMFPPGFGAPPSYPPPPAFSPPAYAPSGYAPTPGSDLLPPGVGAPPGQHGPPSYETPLSFSPPPFGPVPAAAAPPAGIMQLSCPACTGLFQVTPDMAGVNLSCPHCASGMTIPALWGEPAPQYPPSTSAPSYTPAPTASPNEAANLYPPSRPIPRPQDLLPPAAVETVPGSARGGAKGKPEQTDANFYPPGFGAQNVRATSGGQATAEAKPSPPAESKREAKARTEDGPLPRDFYPPSAPAPSPVPAPTQEISSPPLPPGAEALLPPEPRVKTSLGATPSITRRPGPAAESLLPPGLAPARQNDSLLPPGMMPVAAPGALLPPGAAVSAPARADSLLPPGAAPASGPAPGAQVPLPTREPSLDFESKPAKKPARTKGGEPVSIPTEAGGFVNLREPVKTVGKGDDEVELKRLTPEEKAKRRRFRNLLVSGFCFLVIFGVMLFLAYGRK